MALFFDTVCLSLGMDPFGNIPFELCATGPATTSGILDLLPSVSKTGFCGDFHAVPRAARALGTFSSGLTLYLASTIFSFSSMRKEERVIPKYVFTYIDFSPQTP